jgi:hypothetical protein
MRNAFNLLIFHLLRDRLSASQQSAVELYMATGQPAPGHREDWPLRSRGLDVSRPCLYFFLPAILSSADEPHGLPLWNVIAILSNHVGMNMYSLN